MSRYACLQGMPVLAALMEDRLAEAGFLTQTAITCTWHMLQLQGTAFPLNHLCRLLAADGMPLRLVQALSALCTELHPSPAGSQVGYNILCKIESTTASVCLRAVLLARSGASAFACHASWWHIKHAVQSLVHQLMKAFKRACYLIQPILRRSSCWQASWLSGVSGAIPCRLRHRLSQPFCCMAWGSGMSVLKP